MDDLIVVLPGITGSALQKNGIDVWAVSRQSIWGAIKSAGHVIEDLELDPDRDDPALDDIGDGITADRLIHDIHLLPGVAKIDGYSAIVDMVTDRFDVVVGRLGDPAPANFYEFPYDWRRDNRVAARQLKAFVDERLPVWRQHIGREDAGVVLLAHSMGGLVSRYYLEVLGGAETAKALFTFGTPFRGSPQALDALSRGMKKAWLDLSDMLRSFTSVYQLLPIYRVVEVDGDYHRVAEVDALAGVDTERAADALAFHREIEAAVDTNPRDAYVTIPYLGFRQSTIESASLVGGRLSTHRSTPTWIDSRLGGGDGTVPRVSGVPIEMSDEYRDTYVAEQHSSLQSNAQVLDDIEQRLRGMAASGLSSIRGPEPAADLEGAPALGIEVADLFTEGEPVTIKATVFNAEPTRPLTVAVTDVGREHVTTTEFAADADDWSVELEGLSQGVYQLEVAAVGLPGQSPQPVRDVIEILP